MKRKVDKTMWEIISTVTRKQLLEDGDLVDVTKMAKEAGFNFPVAITRGVWAEYIVPSELLKSRYGQDQEGRLWDCLYMLHVAIKTNRLINELYELIMWVETEIHDEEGRLVETKPEQITITLKALCHGGDEGEPVITILLPNED